MISSSFRIESIWDDYLLLDIKGLSGVHNFILYEENVVSYFQDKELEEKEGKHIKAHSKYLKITLSKNL